MASNVTRPIRLTGQRRRVFRLTGFPVQTFVPMLLPPAAPSNLVATQTDTDTVTLTWQDNSDNEDGFSIERDSGAGFGEIDTTAANVESYLDTPLAEGAYSYRARAFNAAGNSDYSNTDEVEVIAEPDLDADAAALIALMEPEPDSTRQAFINNTVVALKAGGIWSKLDELWFTAAHSEQAGLLGWKRYKNLTAVNAPTFTQDRGIAGNGTTSYLNTNFVPSTDSVNYTLNDASFGVYSRTDKNSSDVDIGSRNTASVGQNYLHAQQTNQFVARININSSTGQIAVNIDSSLGLFVARRNGASSQQLFRNGSEVTASTNTSGSVSSQALFIGALNNGGSPVNFSTRQYAFAFVGGALTADEQADLHTIVQDYATAIGAAV